MFQRILWSPLTRIIHWSIALPVLFNFFSEGGDPPHRILGYVALGGVVLRMVWGFVTQDMANFRHFPVGPAVLKSYTQSLLNGEEQSFPGHNPLASVAYILIWILVIALGVTGFMMNLDQFWGEEWLEEFHEALSTGMVGLVISHILGLALDGIRKKRKTWKGMITGKRE